MKRPTIADIARQAGVTKAAVSFALNGHPGVSEATRKRILAIADELGFQPNTAARALSGGTAGALGLVLDRPARMLGIEPFFMAVLSGIQAELSRDHISLLFTTAEDQAAEIELYRTWWAQRRVDGVFLYDLQVRDRRVPLLHKLGMPAVVFGNPEGAGHLPAVWQDIGPAMNGVVGHLAGLGHRRIAHVGGISRYWHTKLRTMAFRQATKAAGIEAMGVECDYTGEHSAAATRELLLEASRPTAIVYDNDVMAVAGLAVAQQMGVDVPAELSIVAWDDSALCQLVHPALTAQRREIALAGTEAARRLVRLVGGEAVDNFQEPSPVLIVRASTGPPGTRPTQPGQPAGLPAPMPGASRASA